MFKAIEITKRAWQILKRDWVFYLGSGALIQVMLYVAHELPPNERAILHFSRNIIETWSVVAGIAALIIVVYSIIVQANVLKKILDTDAGTQPLTSNNLQSIFVIQPYTWKFLWAIICYGFVVGLGSIFFIIPGILFALMYMFVPIMTIEKQLSVGNAFRASKELTDGYKVELLAFTVRVFFLLIIPAILISIPFAILGALAWPIQAAGSLLISIAFNALGNIIFIDIYKKLQAYKKVQPVGSPTVESPTAEIPTPTVTSTPSVDEVK